MDAYCLKISYDLDWVPKRISEILGVDSNSSYPIWKLTLVLPEDQPSDFVSYFLNLLEDKYDSLLEIGIQREDITIWYYYRYDNGQCNLEYSPEEMSRLGENGIRICISCLDSGENTY